MDWDLIFKLAIGALGLGTALVVLLARLKEARYKKKDPTWKLNPTRCQEQRDRLLALEGQNKAWAERFDSLDKALVDIKDDVKGLIRMHLKP